MHIRKSMKIFICGAVDKHEQIEIKRISRERICNKMWWTGERIGRWYATKHRVTEKMQFLRSCCSPGATSQSSRETTCLPLIVIFQFTGWIPVIKHAFITSAGILKFTFSASEVDLLIPVECKCLYTDRVPYWLMLNWFYKILQFWLLPNKIK